MTGSPFSNVLGSDEGSSTFKDVETDNRSDTTDRNAARPPDSPGEPAPGVIVGDTGTHESGQDETAGDAPSGQ